MMWTGGGIRTVSRPANEQRSEHPLQLETESNHLLFYAEARRPESAHSFFNIAREIARRKRREPKYVPSFTS